MGNKGAFITLSGEDLKPNFTTFEAVVRVLVIHIYCISMFEAASKPIIGSFSDYS